MMHCEFMTRGVSGVRKGEISQIKPPLNRECLYVQVGEAMQIVSGGLYHATEPLRHHCGMRNSLFSFEKTFNRSVKWLFVAIPFVEIICLPG